MSRNKRGGAADNIYNDFLGKKYSNNTTVNKQGMTERMYIRVLTELAANRFKWTGFPEEIDIRFLELTLFYQALSVFYFDKRYDKYFALRGGGTNWNNMLDNPVGFTVVGSNFTGMNISATRETKLASKGIPIWANYQRIPDLDIVLVYADRLAELDTTIQINAKNARINKVVTSTENQRLSIDNFLRNVDEGQNVLKLNNGPLADLAFIQALDLGVDPNTHEKLHILRTRMWNECMGLLGIENANQDKKERLVASEVDANMDQTSMMRYVNLNARRQAAELINEEFGFNVEVEYWTDEERNAQIPEVGVDVD